MRPVTYVSSLARSLRHSPHIAVAYLLVDVVRWIALLLWLPFLVAYYPIRWLERGAFYLAGYTGIPAEWVNQKRYQLNRILVSRRKEWEAAKDSPQ